MILAYMTADGGIVVDTIPAVGETITIASFGPAIVDNLITKDDVAYVSVREPDQTTADYIHYLVVDDAVVELVKRK